MMPRTLHFAAMLLMLLAVAPSDAQHFRYVHTGQTLRGGPMLWCPCLQTPTQGATCSPCVRRCLPQRQASALEAITSREYTGRLLRIIIGAHIGRVYSVGCAAIAHSQALVRKIKAHCLDCFLRGGSLFWNRHSEDNNKVVFIFAGTFTRQVQTT